MKKSIPGFIATIVAVTSIASYGIASQDHPVKDIAKQGKQELEEKKIISDMLDNLYDAANKGQADRYLSHIAAAGIFIGTDEDEVWNKQAFTEVVRASMSEAKEAKEAKGWPYRALQRTIVIVKPDIAYFHEILSNTKYSPMRSSGLLVKEADGQWRIVSYHLGLIIPNQLFHPFCEIILNQKAPQPLRKAPQ